MAATILSGTGNVSWTNNSGGNVRVVINYFGANDAGSTVNGLGISMNAGGAIFIASATKVFGKNLAFSGGYAGAEASVTYNNQNLITGLSNLVRPDVTTAQALPTEVYLSDTKTLTLTLAGGTASYNILILPEGG